MRRRIDPASFTPRYHQLADILREAIEAGEYGPGDLLPTELRLSQEYELGIDTVRDAMAVLRREGLVVTRHGHGSRVTERPEPTVKPVGPGVAITSRAPTEQERRRMELPEGTPVFVLSREGEDDEVLPAGPGTVLLTQAEEPEDDDESTEQG